MSENINSHVASETVTVRLTLDVTYSLNGENATEMVGRLRKMCERAIGEGMLTGETDAEVEKYSMDAVIQPEPLSEDELANCMLQRIENGDLANHGLTAVQVFQGYFGYEGTRIDATFQVPVGATVAEKDAAFMAALAQQADIDYLAVGESDKPLPENARRNIFTEAMEAKFISTSISPLEVIRIRRDLVAQEVLGGYPQDTVISREIYDADSLLGECLIWMNSHFEFPNWEGRTVGDFLIKHGIPGEPVCLNVLQHSTRHPNKDGISAENITLQELWDAQTLGESGWLLPSGLEVWFHKTGAEA